MFLGAALLGLVTNTTLLNFLSSQLQEERDPDGIFDRPFTKSYDYIVVGAGSAGSIIATRLSEDPVSVLLLEAGGSDLENEFTRIPFPWIRTIGSKQDWGFSSVPQKYSYFASKDHIHSLARGKVPGGTGSINGMLYARGSRHDYDRWKAEKCTGWGYDDILPYFKKSEDIRIPELMNSSYHGKGGPLVITESHVTHLEFFHRTAAKEKGLPLVDCNGVEQSDISNFTNTPATIVAEAIVHHGADSSGNDSILALPQPITCSTPRFAKKRKTETVVTQEMLMKKQFDVLSVQEEKFKLEIENIKLCNAKIKLEIRRLEQWEIQEDAAALTLATLE